MARLFRLFGKKLGQRRTGSPLVGSLGEAMFFGMLFLAGAIALATLIASHARAANSDALVLGSGAGFWFMVVVFSSLVLIGGGGVIYTVWRAGTSAERRSVLANRAARIELLAAGQEVEQGYPNVPIDADLTNSPGVTLRYRLPASGSPAWSLLAATAFCLVWNALTIGLMTVVVDGFLAGRPHWILAGISVPFLGVSVWAIYYFLNHMLVQTGLGPTSVEISQHPLQPGRTYEFYLTQAGQVRLDRLEVVLECEEEARYSQGTDIRTEQLVVYRASLFRQDPCHIQPGIPFERTGQLSVPQDVMHSFQGQNNAVRWKLVVRGEGKTWRSFQRSFPVVVLPSENGNEAA